MELWEDFTKEEGSNPSMRPLHLLQYHYFFAWLGILVGYAGIVTQMWMVYYPLRLSHVTLEHNSLLKLNCLISDLQLVSTDKQLVTCNLQMHLAIIGVPMIAWLKRKTTAIVVTTQFITIITTVSHAYISFVASNYWGLGGSFLMGLQILSMSLPLRYSFLFSDFSTREVAILFSAANSFLFTKSIEQAAKFPKIYRSA